MSATKPCTRCGGTGCEMDWTWLGRSVREAREAKGWGLRELARRAGCSPAYVSDLEYGRRGGGLSGEKTREILRLVGIRLKVGEAVALSAQDLAAALAAPPDSPSQDASDVRTPTEKP